MHPTEFSLNLRIISIEPLASRQLIRHQQKDQCDQEDVSPRVPKPCGSLKSHCKPDVFPRDCRHCRHSAPAMDAEYRRCLQEVWEVEGHFVEKLQTLSQIEEEILRASILSKAQCTTLFVHLGPVRDVHEAFLSALKSRTQNGSNFDVDVGDLFQTLIASAEIAYHEYLVNVERSIRLIEEMMAKNERVERFFKEFAENPVSKGLYICSFIIAPRSFLPKHAMLVRYLANYRPELEPLRIEFDASLSRLDMGVTQVLRDNEMAQLSRKFRGEIIAPGRFFVASFPVEEWDGVELKRGGMCFIFNDVVMATRKMRSLLERGDGKVKVVAELPVASCQEVIIKNNRFPIVFSEGGVTLSGTLVQELQVWDLQNLLGLSPVVFKK